MTIAIIGEGFRRESYSVPVAAHAGDAVIGTMLEKGVPSLPADLFERVADRGRRKHRQLLPSA